MTEPEQSPEDFLDITESLLRVFGRTGRLLVKIDGAIGYLVFPKDAPIE